MIEPTETKSVNVAVKSIARDNNDPNCPIYLRSKANEIFVFYQGHSNVLFNVVYQNMLLLVPDDYVCIEYIHQARSNHMVEYFKSIIDIKHVTFQPQLSL